jgi:hypothetical protein
VKWPTKLHALGQTGCHQLQWLCLASEKTPAHCWVGAVEFGPGSRAHRDGDRRPQIASLPQLPTPFRLSEDPALPEALGAATPAPGPTQLPRAPPRPVGPAGPLRSGEAAVEGPRPRRRTETGTRAAALSGDRGRALGGDRGRGGAAGISVAWKAAARSSRPCLGSLFPPPPRAALGSPRLGEWPTGLGEGNGVAAAWARATLGQELPPSGGKGGGRWGRRGATARGSPDRPCLSSLVVLHHLRLTRHGAMAQVRQCVPARRSDLAATLEAGTEEF